MKAACKIKRELILRAVEAEGFDPGGPLDTPQEINHAYDRLGADGLNHEREGEFRGGQYQTGIPAPLSRNYESKSVAARLRDGSWVGWTYWYGGGKHGAPEIVDWLTDAYDLVCREEEKVVVVRTFHHTNK